MSRIFYELARPLEAVRDWYGGEIFVFCCRRALGFERPVTGRLVIWAASSVAATKSLPLFPFSGVFWVQDIVD